MLNLFKVTVSLMLHLKICVKVMLITTTLLFKRPPLLCIENLLLEREHEMPKSASDRKVFHISTVTNVAKILLYRPQIKGTSHLPYVASAVA